MHKRYRGNVTKGLGRATQLGFPTINVSLADTGISGIYAARVAVAEMTHPAVAYVNQKRGILEAHLLDFSGELTAGADVAVTFLKKIREDKTFADETGLRQAIAEDVRAAREYFSFLQNYKTTE